MTLLYFQCPHCDGEIIIFNNEINCGIFRHAVFKNGNPVNPHAKKDMCDSLVENDKVFGCCKPFELIKINDTYEIKKCDYK